MSVDPAHSLGELDADLHVCAAHLLYDAAAELCQAFNAQLERLENQQSQEKCQT
jgi:hypothetical protein